MVSVVEPLLSEVSDKLTSVETELVTLTLKQFDECVAPTLTPSCREMNLLLNAVKSRRRIASNDSSLATAAIAQVSRVFHTFSHCTGIMCISHLQLLHGYQVYFAPLVFAPLVFWLLLLGYIIR